MKETKSMEAIVQLLSKYAPSSMTREVYTLDRVKKLLDFLDNPQQKLRVIHVAGTSGKTSTAYYIRGLLEAAGFKTGLTSSPSIVTIRERVQIGGSLLEEESFVAYFTEFYELIENFEPTPTYFEFLTAFAYWVFVRGRVDYAVVEVGLGGRLDATNVVARADKVSVITAIGYDHTDILGETLAEIASEKAGIIQGDSEVFTVEQEVEARDVILAEARRHKARLHVVHTQPNPSQRIALFQQRNFGLALNVVQFIAKRDGFMLPAQANEVMTNTQVPGRFEQYVVEGKTVILDGAHNPQKLRALIESLRAQGIHSAAAVAAFSEAPEKKINECLEILNSFAYRTNFTKFSVQRDVLRHSAVLSGQKNFYESPEDAFRDAMQSEEACIVVTGSLYLVSVIRPFIQLLSASVS